MPDSPTRRERMEEAWLLNEFELGYLQLLRYLKKWAPYVEWCRAHGRKP